MSKVEKIFTDDNGWSRSAWVVFAIIFSLPLLLNLMYWTEGHRHWDALLPYAALLINSLAHVFQLKGLARRISQAVIWLLLIVATIMLVIG